MGVVAVNKGATSFVSVGSNSAAQLVLVPDDKVGSRRHNVGDGVTFAMEVGS